MAKMEAMAQKFNDSKKLAFIAINTNNFELAKKQTQLGNQSSSCYQMFLNSDDKKVLVDSLKIKRVPHLVLLDQCGKILTNGKEFDWEGFISLAGVKDPSTSPSPSQNFSFSLDEDF